MNNPETPPEGIRPEQTVGEAGSAGMTCSASLIWHAGPARGGGGTAEHEPHATHRSWWYDGELLLVIVETVSGNEITLVRVYADGDTMGFFNPETGDDDFGRSDMDISWWAKIEESLPQNAKRLAHADENLNNTEK